MKNIKIDPFSGCACPASIIYKDDILGHATIFFWRFRDQTYLVTNWHVLSGREPSSGQAKNLYGAVPNMIRVAHVTKNNPNKTLSFSVRLTDEYDAPIWSQHETYGQAVDIAVLHLDPLIARRLIIRALPCINEMPQVTDIDSEIGQDIFVLGFPFGVAKTGVFPIWKRASIATEPQYPIDNLPCFLIDTATREGMSGAPVLHRTNSYRQCNSGTILAGPVVTQFLGVYSGRRTGGLGEAQLGIVWRKEILEDIIKNPASGRYILP